MAVERVGDDVGVRSGPEYFEAVKGAWVAAFLLMAADAAWRKSVIPRARAASGGVALLGSAIAVWVGWNAVRFRRFRVRDAAIGGALLSSATLWALPMFHSWRASIRLAATNAAIVGALAAMGGWMARATQGPA